MTNTPIIYAAAAAICDSRGFGFYTDPMEGGQEAYDISCAAIDDATAALRSANPWTPPAKEIEAMARAICDHKGYACITKLERDEVLVVHRARLLMCELYDSDGAPR